MRGGTRRTATASIPDAIHAVVAVADDSLEIYTTVDEIYVREC